MSAIAIISGRGLLPKDIKNELLSKNRELHIIAFHGQTDECLIEDLPHAWFNLGSVNKIIKYLNNHNISEVVMAGSITRPAWSEISLDLKAIMLIAKYGVRTKGDDGLLSAVIKYLESEKIKVISPDEILCNLRTDPGIVTRAKPSEENLADINKGISILNHISTIDIGQAVVIQQSLVLGVEAIEGTEKLISRTGELRRDKSKSGGVLVKIAKLQQSERVDLPTIGPDTIDQLHQAGFAGIAIEAKRSLILAKAETIKRANDLGVFIMGVKVLTSNSNAA